MLISFHSSYSPAACWDYPFLSWIVTRLPIFRHCNDLLEITSAQVPNKKYLYVASIERGVNEKCQKCLLEQVEM